MNTQEIAEDTLEYILKPAPAPKPSIGLCYRLKGQCFYSNWNGSSRVEMLNELIEKYGEEINTIEFL